MIEFILANGVLFVCVLWGKKETTEFFFFFFKYAEITYPLEFTFTVPPSYLHTRAVGYEPYTSSEWMILYGKEVKTLSNNI